MDPTLLTGVSPGKALVLLSRDLTDIDLTLIAKGVAVLKDKSARDQYFGLSDLCKGKALRHPSWNLLAGRILMHEIKDQVPPKFSQAVKKLRPICHDRYFTFVTENHEALDNMVQEERDWKYDILAVKTLLKSYLGRLKREGKSKLMETPQYMFLRVATFLAYPNLEVIQEIYTDLSEGNYIHASPTLFNCGWYRPQLASCFLFGVEDDTKSITKSWANMAFISKNSGGIGFDISSLRHSEIGQNWFTNKGVVPWIRIIDTILQAIDQGGRRKGSGTIYLQPWHLDIEEFLDLKKATGPEDMRARGLFYALWIPDLFMRRVKEDKMWTLFCPNKAKGLDSKWGLEFEMAYHQYERKAEEGKLFGFRRVRARSIWQKILLTQIETGMPFMLFADACNFKSNQRNLGTIRCSNLCTEIVEYTDKDNIASCNLASIALKECVITGEKEPLDFHAAKHVRITKEDQARIVEQMKEDIPEELEKVQRPNKENFSKSLFYHPDNVRYLYAKSRHPEKLPKWWILRYGEWLHKIYQPRFDFSKLEKITSDLVRNLNYVIDRNYYPEDVPQIKGCNFRNRPIGIGVQSLADVFALLDLVWESPEARQLNRDIFETMYYAATKKSVELAETHGPYETFKGSPASQGFFQFDLWDAEAAEKELRKKTSQSPELNLSMLKGSPSLTSPDSRYSWDELRIRMVTHGLRNSLLIALMPTASSASILGNNEAFEPYTEMLYARTVLSGQFTMINKYMVKDLQDIGMWTPETLENIKRSGGSIKNLTANRKEFEGKKSLNLGFLVREFPEEQVFSDTEWFEKFSDRLAFLKKKYKTAFEIPQRVLLDMALDRGRFVCQSQSFNCWMKNPSYTKLNAYHFYAWARGAKTGMYYLRQEAKYNPIDFSSSTPTKKTCDEVCDSCQS